MALQTDPGPAPKPRGPRPGFAGRVDQRAGQIIRSPEFQAALAEANQRGQRLDRAELMREATRQIMEEDAIKANEKPTMGDAITAPFRAFGAGLLGTPSIIAHGADSWLGTDIQAPIERFRESIRPVVQPNSEDEWGGGTVANRANALTEGMGEMLALNPIFGALAKGAQAIPAVAKAGQAMTRLAPVAGPGVRGALEALPSEVVGNVAFTGATTPEQFTDPGTQGQNLAYGVLGALMRGGARAQAVRERPGVDPMELPPGPEAYEGAPARPAVAETPLQIEHNPGAFEPRMPDTPDPITGQPRTRPMMGQMPSPGSPTGMRSDNPLGLDLDTAHELERLIMRNELVRGGMRDPRVEGSARVPGEPIGEGITGQEAQAYPVITDLMRKASLPVRPGRVGVRQPGGSPNEALDPNLINLPEPVVADATAAPAPAAEPGRPVINPPVYATKPSGGAAAARGVSPPEKGAATGTFRAAAARPVEAPPAEPVAKPPLTPKVKGKVSAKPVAEMVREADEIVTRGLDPKIARMADEALGRTAPFTGPRITEAGKLEGTPTVEQVRELVKQDAHPRDEAGNPLWLIRRRETLDPAKLSRGNTPAPEFYVERNPEYGKHRQAMANRPRDLSRLEEDRGGKPVAPFRNVAQGKFRVSPKRD